MTDMMYHRVADRNGSFGTRVQQRLARLGQGLAAGLRARGEAEAQAFGGNEPPEVMARDTGLSREDATGSRDWRADLPFFMQTGFGRK